VTSAHPIIELQGVAKRFGRGVVAVRDLSLTIEPGEIVTVVGPSGCGKTTMLRLIAGFERVDAGRITIAGAVVDDGRTVVAPERRRVGFVFQDYALFPHLSVEANVGFGLRDLRGSARRRRIADVLRICRLHGLESRYPHELSGGQQQRTAVARALAPGCGIVLLDEPLSNLDATLRRSVRGELRDMLREAGATAVIVTHEQEEALEMADRVVVLQDGRLEQIGTPQEVYTSPSSPFVAQFVGESATVPGVVGAGGVATEIGCVYCPARFAHGVQVDVLVRPTQLDVEAAAEGPGQVVSQTFAGTHATAVVRFDSGLQLRCATDAARALPIGTRVSVAVRGCPAMVVAALRPEPASSGRKLPAAPASAGTPSPQTAFARRTTDQTLSRTVS
jgi:iron(III) transport system ATP-binding protein